MSGVGLVDYWEQVSSVSFPLGTGREGGGGSGGRGKIPSRRRLAGVCVFI